MKPFAGKWICDLEKTLAARKNAGTTDAEINEMRKYYAARTEPVHPDLTIDGDVAVGSAGPEPEYRFFRMHNHGAQACGRAWHHEDRHDPGDMSKCHVRLQLIDGALRLDVHQQEVAFERNDPDLTIAPPVENKSTECDVVAKTKATPENWMIYVFVRAK